jgi:hypothetical protein
MSPTEAVFDVARLGSGALVHHVVDVLVPDRDIVVHPKLPLQMIHHRPLRGIASIVSAPPIPSAPAELEFIAQLKTKLQYAELRIRVLEERLRLMRIEKNGAGREKLSQAQMQLFELEPVVGEMIEQAVRARASANAAHITYSRLQFVLAQAPAGAP